MTLLEVVTYSIIVLAVATFVRFFWEYLLILWLLLKVIFWITVGSFMSAVFWMIFIENYKSGPIDGFWNAWLFFEIAYIIVAIVAGLILIDIFNYFRSYARDFLRKL